MHVSICMIVSTNKFKYNSFVHLRKGQNIINRDGNFLYIHM